MDYEWSESSVFGWVTMVWVTMSAPHKYMPCALVLRSLSGDEVRYECDLEIARQSGGLLGKVVRATIVNGCELTSVREATRVEIEAAEAHPTRVVAPK